MIEKNTKTRNNNHRFNALDMTAYEDQLIQVRGERDLSCFDLLSVEDLSSHDIDLILELAEIFKKSKTQKLSLLKGISIINAFYENSTRTRSSFELAGKHLGADTINISGSGSSVKKGESLLDTTETLSALQPQVIVLRSEHSGLPEFVARHVSSSIANAGDGWHEHPSQALLDIMTMRNALGSLAGKTVTIVGDVKHSRVFGSLARILKMEQAQVRVSAPQAFLPEKCEEVFGITYVKNIEDALHGTDVVYVLRVQEERGAKGYIPTIREYSKTYGISQQRLEMANKGALLMHPGPVMRDTDVHSALVTLSDQSRILDQVENGMAVRASILWLLADRKDKRKKIFTSL